MTEFTPRRDVQAISHVNVVVDDIEVATEFYRTVLGFEQAANADTVPWITRVWIWRAYSKTSGIRTRHVARHRQFR